MLVKRREDDELDSGEKGGDRWMLTYSDMITLLLALFIIMYGMSTVNSAKLNQLSSGLEAALNNPAAVSGGVADQLDEVYKELEQYVKDNGLADDIDMLKTDNSVIIHLRDTALFQPDTAALLSGSKPVLEEVCRVISDVYDRIDHVTITGNTADIGLYDAEHEAAGWQLSVDRAVKVLNTLTANGLSPQKLSIEGNSHYDPIASNKTPQGMAQNRRVEITISRNPPAEKTVATVVS